MLTIRCLTITSSESAALEQYTGGAGMEGYLEDEVMSHLDMEPNLLLMTGAAHCECRLCGTSSGASAICHRQRRQRNDAFSEKGRIAH